MSTRTRRNLTTVGLLICATVIGCGHVPEQAPATPQFQVGQFAVLQATGSLVMVQELFPHHCTVHVLDPKTGRPQPVTDVPYANLAVISEEAAIALGRAQLQQAKAPEPKSPNVYVHNDADPMARFRRYDANGDDPANIKSDAARAVTDPNFKYYAQ